MSDQNFYDFCLQQRQRVRIVLNASEHRVRMARRHSHKALDDEWKSRSPGSIGHAMGRRRPTLEDLEQ